MQTVSQSEVVQLFTLTGGRAMLAGAVTCETFTGTVQVAGRRHAVTAL